MPVKGIFQSTSLSFISPNISSTVLILILIRLTL
nr:MAG TPA: hypothetical protein [Caudoviricetes sp.]